MRFTPKLLEDSLVLASKPPCKTAAKFTILLLLVIIFSEPTLAQKCSPVNLDLTTQADVDNFQVNHGPCDLVGNLLVQGADITNLDGLSGLTTVGTILRITNNPALTNIAGLSSLISVDRLNIIGNTLLGSIDGFSGVASLPGSLDIGGNTALTNLNGLSGLTSTGFVNIYRNPLLSNITGLSALASVGTSLSIWENASLTTLDGLSALASVGVEAKFVSDAGLSIIDNSALINVNGLSALTYLRGELWIQDNPVLDSISGLSGVTHADGLAIKNNDALADLGDLSALTGTVDRLVIENNASLKNIDGLSSVFGVGADPGVRILGNASLNNLNGLTELATVTGNVLIHNNDALVGISGLSSLTNVGGDLDVRGNDAMVHINGLSSLTSIGLNLHIENHAAITNLNGLLSLSSVGRNVYVQSNPSLTRCAAMAKLVDSIDDAEPGPGPGGIGIPDVGEWVFIGGNDSGCNTIDEILADAKQFEINPGLNDAWYNPATNGQGFLITVFPEIKQMFLAWFTFDTERPPIDATAILGEPGHRWLTAQGPYEDNTAVLYLYSTVGGVFDSPLPAPLSEEIGEIYVEFSSCNSGTVDYEIPDLGLQGVVPIERIALDNIALCEILSVQ